MRTNIDIDDELMKQAMRATGARTKRAAVEASLRKYLAARANEKALERAMRLRERDRQKAMREGRLDEWFAELQRTGTRSRKEFADANKH